MKTFCSFHPHSTEPPLRASRQLLIPDFRLFQPLFPAQCRLPPRPPYDEVSEFAFPARCQKIGFIFFLTLGRRKCAVCCWGVTPSFPRVCSPRYSRLETPAFPPADTTFPPSPPHSMTQRGLSQLKNDALRSNYSGYLCHPRSRRGKSLPFPLLPKLCRAPLRAVPAPEPPRLLWLLSPLATGPPLPGKCRLCRDRATPGRAGVNPAPPFSFHPRLQLQKI